ncbi:MAG: replication-associated recombination protein A [Candidatus Andersenbacteria bacterium]
MLRTIIEQKVSTPQSYVPLAARMRPRSLGEYEGQEKVLGPGTPLRRAIEQGSAGSLILWGPPGIGKTTLAEIIALNMTATVERVSAVTAGVKDLKEIIGRAQAWRKINKRTVLIVDEIHRFNKLQQDVLLPHVEEGLITLLGATTENPYFEVIAALVSRAEVVRLEALKEQDIAAIVARALLEAHRGLGGQKKLGQAAQATLLQIAGGDARRALNILERAALASDKKMITEQEVQGAAQQRVVQYDKAGDAHYDTISAFIKSMRGSDPDAALFYLFRMLAAGEDPKFIMRRMLIFASEDIGNADPHALMLASAAAATLEWVGLPEAEFALAHAATYLAAAPKSNSVTLAKEAAKVDVMRHGNAVPPDHLTLAPVAGLKKHGKGVGYKYPHDYPGNIVAQQYRPTVIQDHLYYEPGEEGFEREVKRRVAQARALLH